MIKLDKLYFSTIPNKKYKFRYNKNYKNRPSWIEINLDKRVVFIKVLVNDEAFWYRRYFRSFFFPLENTSEDYKNYYNHIAKNYESFVPHEKEIGSILLNFYKELNISKEIKILDLGAGTGIGSIPFVRAGYKNITLVEYSPNMLNNAKNKKELKKCRFICSDIRKLDLKEKFDLIISIFSFGLHAYFDREEMLILWKKIRKHLKSDGIIALTGHEYPVPRTLFKELKSGKLKIIKNYSANWFIGSKKEIKK